MLEFVTIGNKFYQLIDLTERCTDDLMILESNSDTKKSTGTIKRSYSLAAVN